MIILRIILDLVSNHQESREFLTDWTKGKEGIYDLFADIWNQEENSKHQNVTLQCYQEKI